MNQFFKEEIDFSSYENNTYRTVHRGYYLPKVRIKDYNVTIGGKNFSDQPVKSDMRTYDEMITQREVYWIILISKIIVRRKR